MSGTDGAPFGAPQEQAPYGRPALPPRGALGAPGFQLAGPPPEPRPAGARGGRRRAGIAVLCLLGLLLAGLLAGEFATRAQADGALAERAATLAGEIRIGGSALEGGFRSDVDGFTRLGQRLSGGYAHAVLDGREAALDGRPYRIVYDLYGLPVDPAGQIERVEVAVELAPETFAELFAAAGGAGLPEGEPSARIEDGRALVSIGDPEQNGARFELVQEVRDGRFRLQLRSLRISVDGASADLGGAQAVELPSCAEAEGVRVGALEARLEDGVAVYRWRASGPGARLARLGEIGACMAMPR